MSVNLEIKIFDPDPRVAEALRKALGDLSAITIQVVDRMLYLEPPRGIDVLYLPLTVAEGFGSKPLVHKSEVLATSPEDQEHGLPAFVVTGTCLAPDDPRGPVPEMRILLSAVFDAIRAFNRRSGAPLVRVGFWAYNLLPGLTASELRDILLSVVPELRA